MAATFNYAVKYKVKATCKTPLRTGDANGETDAILSDKKGNPFVQGNSIAGALRAWLQEVEEADLVENLFGSQKKEGHLIISDGIFSEKTNRQIRSRIRINGKSGVVIDGALFKTASIEAGSTFHFFIIWRGFKENVKELSVIEQMFAAMEAGIIRLGAQKSVGFGVLELEVKKSVYDLMKEADRKDWLKNKGKEKKIDLSKLNKTVHVVFELKGKTDNILIKDANTKISGEKTITGNMMEGNRSVIPGSSIKGVIRSRVLLICKQLSLSEEVVGELFGTENQKQNNEMENRTGKSGKVLFKDIYLDNEKKKEISRIRINRFTGGVIRENLFQEEPLSGDVTMQILVPDEALACMLIFYALRDLGIGLYNIGSGGAIGRGYIDINSINIKNPNGSTAGLFFKKGRCTLEDKKQMIASWAKSLEGSK